MFVGALQSEVAFFKELVQVHFLFTEGNFLSGEFMYANVFRILTV